MAEVRTGPKLGLFGPMKTLDSAQYGFEELPGGRFRAWIKHDTMKGVTPPILRWWFEHIDTFSSYNGQDFSGPPVPVYRFWHPFDHIAIRWAKRVHGLDGRLGPGSVIAIQENIAAKHPVRAKARVTRFDEEAFNFEPLLGGLLPVGQVVHEYAPVEDGVSFYTCVEIGITTPIIGPVLNWIIRKVAFSTEMFQDWILHNIEESGETEKFVPALFAHAHAEE